MRNIVGIFVLLITALGGVFLFVSGAEAVECTENSWTGTADTDWNNLANWSCGSVPILTTNVTIPASANPNFPIASGDIQVHDFTVDAGASFDLNGYDLLVDNLLTNNGTLIDERAISQTALPLGSCFFCTGGYKGLMLSRANSPNNPAAVEVRIKGNQGSCDSGNSTIGRCFDLSPTITESISIDAIFYFSPAELNGLTCDQLQAYHWDGGGWFLAGSHVSNDCEAVTTPEFSITTENISTFSPFAGATSEPLAISIVDIDGQPFALPAMVGIGALLILLIMTGGIVIQRRGRFHLLFTDYNQT